MTDDVFDDLIDRNCLQIVAVHASGPGGQHVNKVSTAIQLRFHIDQAEGLSPPVKARLKRLAGRRLTGDGVLVIDARRHRSQAQNRREALDRLQQLISDAFREPKKRRPTGPGRAARERRLSAKRHRSRLKRLRGGVDPDA